MQLPIFKRDITVTIAQRLKENRNFIQVISGPRQVGKTTAIRQVLEEIGISYHYAAADLPAPPPVEWIAQQWDIGRRKALNEKSVILILDEVQKISSWSEEVKRLWDEDTRQDIDLKVVLLGSSALLIQKGLTESLAGRFEVIRLGHWSWKECQDCFNWDVDRFIYFGGYPGAATLIDNEERWSQYVRDSLIETAISKDILLLNRVEKPALLRQLFVLACEYGGQILSYQKLLGQLADAGNTTTLAHYQRLLESAFLIKGLQKWSGGALRRRSSSPKWMPLNTALMTSLANKSFQEWRSDPDMWGRLVEVSVGAHLVNEGVQHSVELYYWRKGNNEVDFILSKGSDLVAIEVKSGKRHTTLPGLEFFRKKYKIKNSMLIGMSGINIKDFFETPILEWFK
ncbi:MAG: AAA family ATPase [Candidatus Omnitrophica bacterium CG_4_9_14_0_2_um_filter_42_8]|nr:MAG: AAA family ATPase [Candidatus Omnitrophica bacterium CG22_combo_CG10-13_8_21_14_all_43_16]PJC47017.1 MAG: AAA family ATPase [Candidatus Omnitrophica bacterium CG_4_9_14_0_2_um_filter_42_8]